MSRTTDDYPETAFTYTSSWLKDPSPAYLRRRLIVSLDRFTDDDIASFDYGSWNRTETAYSYPQAAAEMENLIADIECNGLRKKIEIMLRGDFLYVADGHHRVVALKRLGWTHVPYRWFTTTMCRNHPQRARLPEKRTS